MSDPTIVVAGASGNLGERIVKSLRERGASVRAIVRRETAKEKIERLQKLGATIATVDTGNLAEVTKTCEGASCVVSSLQGLRDVIVESQTILLEAAIKAGVARFVPSDFSIDFTKLPAGENRNLDLRRDFHERLYKTSIGATSILNGAFMEILTGRAPIINFKLKQVAYWGDADQLLDFTTMDDTASFTANAALDPSPTPRILRIAGDQISPRGLAGLMSELTGEGFQLLQAGSIAALESAIAAARAVDPATHDLYPKWQGMQYMHGMFSGRAKLVPLDNDRYRGMRWTTARDLLAAR
jgi:nucleoside-diphosphate-sugar epimerase